MDRRILVIQRVFREVFDDEELLITPETRATEVPGWDSIAQVKIILALEEELNFRFATEEVSQIRSVGEILSALDRHAIP